MVTQQSLNTEGGAGSVTLPGIWSSCSSCSCSAPSSHLDKGALAFFLLLIVHGLKTCKALWYVDPLGSTDAATVREMCISKH